MEIIITCFILALLFGLLFRKKGDGFLDTIQSGCWILVVLGLIIIGYFIYNGSK
jgi:undecaprenyl pyrophosphate phosphatase UppP